MRGDEHDTGHMMNYTQYVSNITQKIISKEYLEAGTYKKSSFRRKKSGIF